MVAHVGPFVEPIQTGPLASVASAIAADVKPHRDALERIDDLDLYYLFSSHDYHSIERIVRQRIGADVEQRFGSAAVDEEQFPSNPILLREITSIGAALARQAIVDHPGAYARHVAAQLYGLWFLPLFQTPANVGRLSAALEEVRAASPALDRSEVAFRRVPTVVFVAIRVLFLTILTASIAVILLAADSPHTSTASACVRGAGASRQLRARRRGAAGVAALRAGDVACRSSGACRQCHAVG